MRKGVRKNELIKLRIKAVALLTKGLGPKAIAAKLGVRRQTVTDWRHIYEEGHTRGLLTVKAPRTAKKSKLSESQLSNLLLFLEGSVVGERWSCRRVQTIIQKSFNVEYSISGIRFLLKQLGYKINNYKLIRCANKK